MRRASRARERRTSSTCGFGGTTFERDRLDLVAVETDGGPLGRGAAPLSSSASSPRPARGRDGAIARRRCRRLSAAAAYALQQLINALALAAVYALLATAYSLIYGLVGRINLAFGEIAVLGAYGAIGGVAAAVALGIGDPIAGLALALVHRGGDRGRLEPAGRPRRGRAAARAPPARPADPDRDRRGRAVDAGIPAHHARARASAGRRRCSTSRSRWRARRISSSP